MGLCELALCGSGSLLCLVERTCVCLDQRVKYRVAPARHNARERRDSRVLAPLRKLVVPLHGSLDERAEMSELDILRRQHLARWLADHVR